jgi:hypothetical protein
VRTSTTTVAPGAAVDGRLRHVSNFPFVSTSWWIARFVFWIALTISVLVLGLILVALVPGPMESAARAAWSIGASIGWGFVLLLGLPVAAILVLVTLVGIPLGLSILLALWFLFTVGYTVGLFAAGRRLVRPPGGRMKAFLAGWGVLRAIALVPVLGGIAWTITTLLGLGAIAVAVWRSRRAVQAGSAPSPAPPPRPSAPVPPPAPAGAP